MSNIEFHLAGSLFVREYARIQIRAVDIYSSASDGRGQRRGRKPTVAFFLWVVNSLCAGISRSEGALDSGAWLLDIHLMAEREVNDEDFKDILAQTRTFIQKEVIPRENEIAEKDLIP